MAKKSDEGIPLDDQDYKAEKSADLKLFWESLGDTRPIVESLVMGFLVAKP